MANITEMASWLQGKTETKGYRWIPQYLDSSLYKDMGNTNEVKILPLPRLTLKG